MIFLTELSAAVLPEINRPVRKSTVNRVACVLMLCAVCITANEARAQQKNPCEDSLYLRLKEAPAVTLTDSERRYVEQKRKDCAAYKAGIYKPAEPVPTPQPTPPVSPSEPKTAVTPAPKDSAIAATPQPAPVKPEPKTQPAPDTPKPEQASQEPPQEKGEAFLTPRTVGIMGAIAAAIVGLAIALGGAPKSPF